MTVPNVIVLPLPDKIPCDRNGLPYGHELAVQAAREEMSDWINELPDSVYHTGPTDMAAGVDRILARYFAKVVRER